MSKAGWIVFALALIAGLTVLVLVYGEAGIFIAGAAMMMLLVGIDRLSRWRSSRLARAIKPGESLVAAGIVSEGTYNESAGILVRDASNRYRMIVADGRESMEVNSFSPALATGDNPYDLKQYLELHTVQGPMRFAPRNSFFVAKQGEYARQILTVVLDGNVSSAT